MSVLLRTDGIKKAYGGVQALDGATVSVEEGTVAGLIGPNGSGKTTLFNVITGYERPDEGQVYFGDVSITNQAPDKVFAAGIGRTFQLTRIFPRLTVIENMLIAAQAQYRPRGVLSWFGKDAWTHHRRHATERHRSRCQDRRADLGTQHAGGQTRRCFAAPALGPRSVVLDGRTWR